MIEEGNYESSLICCERTLCGYTGEIPCENSTDRWKLVTCKKCLKLQGSFGRAIESEEKAIVQQMGDMTDFFEKEKLANNYV